MNNVILVFGKPGSGKSTICSRLASISGYHHFSTGEILRSIPKRTGVDPVLFKNTILRDEDIYNIVRREIGNVKAGDLILLDGFPRNEKQYNLIIDNPDINIVGVFYLICSDEVCLRRVLSRGGERLDDTEEAFNKRTKYFSDTILPLIDTLKEGLSYCKDINTESNIEDVVLDLTQSLAGRFNDRHNNRQVCSIL